MKTFDDLNSYRIILASRSPRRKQLLRNLGLKFDVLVKEYDETYPENLVGEDIARYVAYGKALTFKKDISDNEIVITADTIVWCNNKVLGKPLDYNDAISILKEISGNTHEVITGVCLLSSRNERTFSVSTSVNWILLILPD